MRVLIAILMATTFSATASVCKKWSPVRVVGTLNHNYIEEASGIALSRGVANRLYHVNDSGDANSLYVTDANGANTQKIRLTGFLGFDTEDMAYGKCGNANCVYIADIGDNKKIRPTIQIAMFKEAKQYPSTMQVKVVTARYPDGPHNAEGMAMHPNGDMYIVTKEYKKLKGPAEGKRIQALTAKVYRLPARSLFNSATVNTLEYVGDINLPKFLKNVRGITERDKIVTSFDISPDGKRMLLLTYKMAIELNVNLSNQKIKPVDIWRAGVDYSIIPTTPLPQQEAITYFRKGRAVLYNTEYADDGGVDRVDLFTHTCVSL